MVYGVSGNDIDNKLVNEFRRVINTLEAINDRIDWLCVLSRELIGESEAQIPDLLGLRRNTSTPAKSLDGDGVENTQ